MQKDAIVTMLRLQDAMNSRVHTRWREQGNAWYRAIWLECAELLDHYGWKWWKAQDADMPQVELELIDIWHFGLSISLERIPADDSEALATLAESIADIWPQDSVLRSDVNTDDERFRESIEHFASCTLQSKRFDIPAFVRLLSLAGLSFEALYRRYVAKNVLNMFRQDHGYKEGSYVKIWSGMEDNEHLMALLDELGQTPDADLLYQALQERYEASAS